MSLMLVFTPDAKLDWLGVSMPLQELVLDELDRLTEILAPRAKDYQIIRKVRHPGPPRPEFAIVRIVIVAADESLVVLGVAPFEPPGFPHTG
jgi:hypothetical protein